MMNYILEIVLKSPLTSAAGEGRVGLVDRDVAFDEMGLPILPGRRLKGLWREAYRDVVDAWQQCGQIPTPVDVIFGSSGQGPDSGSASIYVANAELKEAPSLKKWLQYLQHHKIQKLHADDVVQYYANVRAQTAINRCTGSAEENTLRLTRTLKSNLMFYAPVRFVDDPNQDLINALALGATALQHMGTARTRGLGKVKCRLLELKQNGQPCDLTPALNQNTLPSIESSGSAQSSQVPTGQPIVGVCSNLRIPTHVLRYRFILTAAAVIPGSDGDPNTIVTRQDIPGSHLWGAAAWHYLNQDDHTPADNAFRYVFLDGGLRFLAAYPEKPETTNTQHLRLIPIPHSIRKFKDTEEVVDFVEWPPENAPMKRLDRRYAKISDGLLETQTVKTERNYHHARASKNRRIGRALGAEVPDGGAFFTYEAIQPGQSFQGAVLGAESDLTDLKTWLQSLKTVSIGRSRSAQYGESEFEWIDEIPLELNGLVEWNGFNTQQTLPNHDEFLTITTLSPLLTVNDNGHPDVRFPNQELAHALGLDASELKLSASYTRTEMVSGYHTHLRLPRQQWPAIAAGSVFVFELGSDIIEKCQAHLVQLEHDGLGLRKGEGYGRIAVNRHGHLGIQTERRLDDPENANVPNTPEAEITQDLLELLRGVVQTRCIAEMQEMAQTVASRVENIPSNSLLGRLRLFLQQDPAVAVERLGNLRKPAKDGLTNCQITRGTDISWLPNTLYVLFEKAWNNPEMLTTELISKHVKNFLRDTTQQERLINLLAEDDRKAMCKVFLNHLLTVLYRR